MSNRLPCSRRALDAASGRTLDSDRVRALVLELWSDATSGLGAASTLIAKTFRRERLDAPTRQIVKDRFYRMLAWMRRVDHLLEETHAHLDSPRAWDEARYVASLLLGNELDVQAAGAAMPKVEWQQVVALDAALAADPLPLRRLALHRSLPDFLARRLLDQYGDEADALAASLNEPAPLTLRANTLMGTRDELAALLREDGIATTPGRFSPTALHVQGPVNVFRLDAFRNGRFEVQDEASQLVALLVAPPPHARILDACAGAGGKTLALAAALHNAGQVMALDTSAAKLHELRRRARRAGAFDIQARAVPTDSWPPEIEALAARAERILTDVPCSGVGAFRRNPDARWQLDEADLERVARLQLAIARRAAAALKPGARLIYATCTLLRAENESVVEQLLEDASLELVRAVEVLGKELAAEISDPSGTFLKTLPHRHGTDGFFAAVLRRKR